MKKLSVIIIALLLCMVIITNIQSIRAQGTTVASGFWFIRRPTVPAHIEQGAREGLVLEINRLTMLSTIPLGVTDVTDYAGNPIVWDQAQLDAVDAKIVELQMLLDAF